MLRVAWIAPGALLSALRSRGDLLLEVLALRQQLAAFKVRGKEPGRSELVNRLDDELDPVWERCRRSVSGDWP